jgi:two-component system, cell cycle response regulator
MSKTPSTRDPVGDDAFRIVVVEDEKAARELFCSLLAGEGYAVHSAGSAAELERVLASIPPPDLVLMDMKLGPGGREGVELIEGFEEKFGISTSFVVITAFGDFEVVARLFELGKVRDFLQKPCDRETFLLRIRRVQRDLRREREVPVDAVTGVWNRQAFEVKLEEAIRAWGRHLANWKRNPDYAKLQCWDLTLVMTDIDDFRSFNERHGHRYGDFVLRETAQGMRTRLRSTDFLARYGGEEFGIVMPQTDHANARMVFDARSWELAETSRRTMKEVVTMSAGIATLTFDLYLRRDYLRSHELSTGGQNRDSETNAVRAIKEQLVKAADWALYQIKNMKKASGGRFAGHSHPCNPFDMDEYRPPSGG